MFRTSIIGQGVRIVRGRQGFKTMIRRIWGHNKEHGGQGVRTLRERQGLRTRNRRTRGQNQQPGSGKWQGGHE